MDIAFVALIIALVWLAHYLRTSERPREEAYKNKWYKRKNFTASWPR